MGDFEIREIQESDISQVVDLWQRTGVTKPWNDPLSDVARSRQSPHCVILMLLTGGHLVATAMVGEDGHRGWLYYVAVDPQQQKQGYGRAIVAASEEWLAKRGIAKVNLLVRRDNQAAGAFYESLQYRDGGNICFSNWALGSSSFSLVVWDHCRSSGSRFSSQSC